MLINLPLKVVVIDDDPNICQIFQLMLEHDKELAITTFTDPNKAFDHIRHTSPNIVFVDINMGDTYGDQILKKIKDLREGIHVIMISAELNLITMQACQSGGAECMLSKPLNKEELLQVIANSKEDFNYWNSEYQNIVGERKS